jgi:hypothetical protein
VTEARRPTTISVFKGVRMGFMEFILRAAGYIMVNLPLTAGYSDPD